MTTAKTIVDPTVPQSSSQGTPPPPAPNPNPAPAPPASGSTTAPAPIVTPAPTPVPPVTASGGTPVPTEKEKKAAEDTEKKKKAAEEEEEKRKRETEEAAKKKEKYPKLELEPESGDRRAIAKNMIESHVVATLSLFCRDSMHPLMNVACGHCLRGDLDVVKRNYPNQRAIHVYADLHAMQLGILDVLWHYKDAAPPYPAGLTPTTARWKEVLTIVENLGEGFR